SPHRYATSLPCIAFGESCFARQRNFTMYDVGVRGVNLLVASSALFVAVLGACGSSSRDLLVRGYDAGTQAGDAASDVFLGDAGPDADLTLGGPCVDDPQCNDDVPCTFDAC